MLKKSILMTAICLLMAGSILAQIEKPLPADNIMTESYAKAKVTGKNVFLLFHATWCSWCKRLDKVMQSEELKSIFENNFVITHLDVDERDVEAIAKFENPGGKELKTKLGAKPKDGIPFYAFLNKDGKILANSKVMPKDGNIGYPGSEEEIALFMKIIKIGAPKMTDDHFNTIAKYLKENAPKQ
jgi:thioredoxin-related protein